MKSIITLILLVCISAVNAFALNASSDELVVPKNLLKNSASEVVKIEAKDPVKVGLTKLMKAAKVGDMPTFEKVIAKTENIDEQNNKGVTALMIAAKYGNTHIVKYLLKEGADENLENVSGLRAIDFAKLYQREDVVDVLMNARKYRS